MTASTPCWSSPSLKEFVDLKLKNYSSGMLVRLAFSLMMEVDADVLLIDEVLAVGDAAFQQKCGDAFREMKAQGKTVVLGHPRHDHGRGLLPPRPADRRGSDSTRGRAGRGRPALPAPRLRKRQRDRRRANGADKRRRAPAGRLDRGRRYGTRLTNVEHDKSIHLRVELEVRRDVPGIGLGFILANADGVGVFQFGAGVSKQDGTSALAAGDRVAVSAEVKNLLAPGRYFVHTGVNLVGGGGVALYVHNSVDFVVYGGESQPRGIVSLPYSGAAVVVEADAHE